MFRARSGRGKHLPLFVFMAGLAVLPKNFMHTLGHFDIYGCLLAICLLLVPAAPRCLVLARGDVLDHTGLITPHPYPDVGATNAVIVVSAIIAHWA